MNGKGNIASNILKRMTKYRMRVTNTEVTTKTWNTRKR